MIVKLHKTVYLEELAIIITMVFTQNYLELISHQ